MKWLAHPINEVGRAFDRRGQLRIADFTYAVAARIAPGWDAPWFNRGILAKAGRKWPECRRYNLRATDLDPSFSPAWWNLGIAATALGDWPLARQAWSRYGVEVPPGEGPLELNLGPVPIRLAPDSAGEVVWCRRIDPARAIIANVPLPDCDRTFGDIVLHDGEPKGRRIRAGREVPVFNELELLTPSSFCTFQAHVTARDADSAQALEMSALPGQVAIEDWSTIRLICTACSQGIPHEHKAPDTTWNPERRFGIAAESEAIAMERLQYWTKGGEGRSLRSLECVLARG
jgi:hypothetical protein